MSEVLGRTWAFLTSSGTGPRWTVPSNQSTQTSHLPHGLAQFMQAVFDAPTLGHQREIIRQQLGAVDSKLKEPRLKTNVLADCIVRAMVCYIAIESSHSNDGKFSEDNVGIDPTLSTNFSHIHALQLAQKGTIPERKLGYLACALMIHESDELLLLLINTILRDLKSSNVVEINMALIAVASSNLVPAEMAPLLVPIIAERTKHSKDFIRKKALICLGQFYRNQSQSMSFSSSYTGSHISPEMNQFMEEHVQACLTDVDPGVVGAAVQVITTIILSKPSYSKENMSMPISCSVEGVILGLLSIQEQILDGKLPQPEYVYQDLPAPWMQVDILHLLSIVSQQPELRMKIKSDIWNRIAQVLLRTYEHITLYGGSKNMIGHAVDLECTHASATMLCLNYESPENTNKLEETSVSLPTVRASLRQKALQHMIRFIQSKNNNMKYAGLTGLENLLQSTEVEITIQDKESCDTELQFRRKISEDLQNGVMLCLENSDTSVRQKALSLLPLMATVSNARSICDKIIGQIRSHEAQKMEEGTGRKDLIQKVLSMAEKFYLRSLKEVDTDEPSEVSFDWYVFVLVRLLQAAHGELRDAILLKIKRTLLQSGGRKSDDEKAVTEIEFNDVKKIGVKLTGILRKLVFNNLTNVPSLNDDQKTRVAESCPESLVSKKGTPITVLLLYLWCESHFFMHNDSSEDNEKNSESACETSDSRIPHVCDKSTTTNTYNINAAIEHILKIGVMHKEILDTKVTSTGESKNGNVNYHTQKRHHKAHKVLVACLDALFQVITYIPTSGIKTISFLPIWDELHSFVTNFCNKVTNGFVISYEISDLANEVSGLMSFVSNPNIAMDISKLTEDFSDDFTVSFLDNIVVSALETTESAENDTKILPSSQPYRPSRSWRWKEKIKKENMDNEKLSMSNLIWNTSIIEQRPDVVMNEESKSESKSVETLSFVESESSGTSQSFSNIPELWTIEGRTKSPTLEQLHILHTHGTKDTTLTPTDFFAVKQKSENNNVKEQATTLKTLCDNSALIPTEPQDVEEAIDVLENLDNWTD